MSPRRSSAALGDDHDKRAGSGVVVDAGRCNVGCVTGPRTSTGADRWLMAELAATGLQATPRQFKRWREAGVLASPTQVSAGRGAGRTSVGYPTEAVAQAVTILELLDYRVPLEEMAVAMFLREAPVTEDAVRDALLSMLPRAVTDGDDEARTDLVDRSIARLLRRARRIPLLRHWSRYAGGRNRQAGVLSGVLTALFDVVYLGTYPSKHLIESTGHVLGLTTAESARFYHTLGEIDIDTLQETAKTVSLRELREAKEQLAAIVGPRQPGDDKPDFASAGLAVLAIATIRRNSV